MEMSEQNEANEYLCLKLLLDKWKLPHLLHYFLAQKINVEILKIMKPHHISEAVNCFPLGDRIRFEYELENWRHKMGVPLEGSKISSQPVASKQQESKKIVENIENSESQATNEMPKATMPAPETSERQPALPFILPKPPTDAPSETTPRTLRPLKPRIHHPASAAKRRRFVPPKELIAENPLNIDARTILMQCEPRGPQLMQTYETRRCFTADERGELINLFAKFFYQHSIHLSLKMSHVLENQILKLFPGERLKDYRTEKRGRIYIRLGNIKNFKARSARAKLRQHSVQQYVISSVQEDDEQAIMTNDGLDDAQVFDESNLPDVESNSAEHFLCTEIKTESDENAVFEPETQLVETEGESNENYFE